MATCHPVIGATWPVNSSGTVTGATGPRWRSTVVNGVQRQSTSSDHRELPSNHRSTVVDRRSIVMSGCHVDLRVSHVCPRGIHVDDDVAYTMEPKPGIELKTSRVGTQ
ncbi:hypothetical protein Tco_0902643 [Tanacetum coccineum]